MFASYTFSHLFSVLKCVYFAFIFKTFFLIEYGMPIFFSFSILKILFYCLLASIISSKKPVIIFVVLLFVTCLFSDPYLRFFLIFHQKFYLMYQGIDLL